MLSQLDSEPVLHNQAMASQSFSQASGMNSYIHPNPSGSQVDLTLRLGLPKECEKNLPHFSQYANPAPMNPQHDYISFSGHYTQATNHFGMVYGRNTNLGGQVYDTNHNPWLANPYMNSDGVLGQPYNYSIPPMPQMNEYTLLNPSSRRHHDRGNGSSSSSKKSSRRQFNANYNDPSKRCTNYNCGTNNTPMWRKGPLGPKSLCNACGIKYRKEEEKRKTKEAAANSGTSSQDKE